MSSEQCRIKSNLQILKVVELTCDTLPSSTGSTISCWISLALLKLKRILKHTSVFQNISDSLSVTYSCWHLTLSVKHKNCLSTFELNSYKVIIISVIIKPLQPKIAHTFGYRLILSASAHSHIWLVIVTTTKQIF